MHKHKEYEYILKYTLFYFATAIFILPDHAFNYGYVHMVYIYSLNLQLHLVHTILLVCLAPSVSLLTHSAIMESVFVKMATFLRMAYAVSYLIY